MYYISTEHLYEYIVEVEISAADVEVLQQLKDIVDNTSLPIRVSDSINITEVNITIGKNILWNILNNVKLKEMKVGFVVHHEPYFWMMLVGILQIHSPPSYAMYFFTQKYGVVLFLLPDMISLGLVEL